MASTIEFILVLLSVSAAVLIFGVYGTYLYRKRAQARRLKRHFSSKSQSGRPTQS